MNKNLETKACEPPDFSDWRTNRLKFLLAEYREAFRAIKSKQSGIDIKAEAAIYEIWVAKMETELARRKVRRTLE